MKAGGIPRAWNIAILVLGLSGCPRDEQLLVVNATGMSLDIVGDDNEVIIPDGQSKEIRRGDGLVHWVSRDDERFPWFHVRIERRDYYYSMTDDLYRSEPGKKIAMRFDNSDCATIYHIDDQATAIGSGEPAVGRDCQ